MEVQDLACKALTVNVRFRLSPHLVDNRGALVRRLEDRLGTTEFGLGNDAIDVFTTDERDHFRLSGRDLIGSLEHFEDFDAAAQRVRAFVEEGLAALEVQTVAFLGVRTHWIAATDDFGALRDELLDRLGGGSAKLADLAGKRATDAGWVFEFHDKDPRVTVRMGPMKSDQAIAQVFRLQDPELYPPDFLFLDVDRVLSDDEKPADGLLGRLDKAIEHNRTLSGRFGRYFSSLASA